MKYNKILVKNFKGIEEKEYIPKNSVCVLTGLNGAGKTSFMEAVRFTCTGKAPANCIRVGHESAEIVTELNGKTIQYEKGTKGTVIKMDNEQITAKKLFEFLYGNSMVDNKVAENITYGELLEKLEPADFANLLLRYVPDELTFDILKSYLPKKYIDSTPATREKVEFSVKQIDKSAEELKKAIPDEMDKFGIKEIEELQNLFTEQKKEYKKLLEILYKEYSALPKNTEPNKKDVSEIEQELKQIYEKIGAQSEIKNAIECYNKALNARNSQLQQIDELEKKIKEIKVKEKPLDEDYQKIQKEIQQYNKTKEELQLSVTMIKESIEKTKQTIDKLSQPICVLSEKLKCSTDKRELSKELSESISSLNESVCLQEKQLVDINKKIEVLLKNEAEFKQKKENWERKEYLVNHLESIKSTLIELPEKVENDLEDTENRKKELEAMLSSAKINSRIKELRVQLSEATEKYHIYNYLAISLSKKGLVYEKILEYYLSYFDNICNETTKQIGKNFKIKFYFKEGVHISCKADRNNYYVPYVNLSSGEKMFASIIILDMLTQLTCAIYEDETGKTMKSGVNVLFFDGMEKMDKITIEKTLKFLTSSEIANYYDHIFINMVNHENLESLLSVEAGSQENLESILEKRNIDWLKL